MWSKTIQILEIRLAENLKGRVSFHYDVYHTNKDKVKKWWFTENHVFSVIVDGKPWFCSNPEYFRLMYQEKKNGIGNHSGLWLGSYQLCWGLPEYLYPRIPE